MASQHKLNISLIGCGYWGPNFIRIIQNSDHAFLSKVCDVDVQKLNLLRKKNPSVLFFDTAEEIINDPKIDAVVVCTPVKFHFELTKKLLQAGKHVLCEKPLAQTFLECEELKLVAEKADKKLLVGHVFEYNSVVKYMKHLISEKTIGDVLYLQFTRTGLGPIRNDVNVVYDLASHDVSMAISLLNKIPAAVTCSGSSFIQEGIEDVAFIQLEFPDKILVNITVSWIDPMKQRLVKIVGSKKMLVFDDVSITEKLKIIETGKDYQNPSGDFGSFQLSIKDGEIVIPNLPHPEPLLTEFNHFINCIKGSEKIITNAEHAGLVVKILEAVQSSLKNNGAKVILQREK